jgi:hypothetical protein
MTTYLIEGKTVKVEGQLTDSEIDEIGASIRATTKPKSVGGSECQQDGRHIPRWSLPHV